MRKASFKVVNANSHSQAHNDRTNAPKYLIEPDSKFDDNYYDLKYSDSEYLSKSQIKYFDKNKQKMQRTQKDTLIKEGFNPLYFTNVWKNKKGSRYFFCYEYGYLLKEEHSIEKYVLIQWQNYMH